MKQGEYPAIFLKMKSKKVNGLGHLVIKQVILFFLSSSYQKKGRRIVVSEGPQLEF